MDSLWPTLVQFLLRLSFGLSLAMAITPSRWVTSGFYRVHLWVVMGLATFTSLAVYNYRETYLAEGYAAGLILALTISLAIVSYMGGVIWLYEIRQAGLAFLLIAAGLAFSAGMASLPRVPANPWQAAFHVGNWCSAGSSLGLLIAAMFLGHWYLNWPGMKLDPLRRLVWLGAVSLGIRLLFSLVALSLAIGQGDLLSRWTAISWSLYSFRLLAGIVGPAFMSYLTWHTLRIPNTQSATGILYAAVVLLFLGELTSQLLSRSLPLPV